METVHTVEMTEESFESLVAREGITVIDFWANWCGPCKAFGPIFEKVAMKYPDVTFAKVDTEAQQGLAGSFNVRSVPTLAIFRDGIMLFRQPGMLPEEALVDLVTQTRALNMDEVREQIARHEQSHGDCGGSGGGCGCH